MCFIVEDPDRPGGSYILAEMCVTRSKSGGKGNTDTGKAKEVHKVNE